jgi:hypothetical protein
MLCRGSTQLNMLVDADDDHETTGACQDTGNILISVVPVHFSSF